MIRHSVLLTAGADALLLYHAKNLAIDDLASFLNRCPPHYYMVTVTRHDSASDVNGTIVATCTRDAYAVNSDWTVEFR